MEPDLSVEATLYYFKGRGMADSIRWVLAATGTTFCQRYIETPEQFEMLSGAVAFGKIPMLHIDGMQIVESEAIVRYIARRSGILGRSELEITLCDQIAEAIRDVRGFCVAAPFERKRALEAGGKFESSPEFDAKLKKGFATLMERLEKILVQNGTGWLVGEHMTYVDVLLAHTVTWYVEELGASVVSPFAMVVELQNTVICLPQVRRFIRSDLYYSIGDLEYCQDVWRILKR